MAHSKEHGPVDSLDAREGEHLSTIDSALVSVPGLAVVIELHLTSVVEHHRGSLVRTERGPFWKPGMRGVARPCKLNQGSADFRREFAGSGRASRHMCASIRVVEEER